MLQAEVERADLDNNLLRLLRQRAIVQARINAFAHASVLNLSSVARISLEGLVAQHLQAWCSYTPGQHRLYYWQTRAKVEIDFVVYGESGMYVLEVKNTRHIRPEDLRALARFDEAYPQSRRYLLYRGKERLVRNGVLRMPCEEFLVNLQPWQFPD